MYETCFGQNTSWLQHNSGLITPIKTTPLRPPCLRGGKWKRELPLTPPLTQPPSSWGRYQWLHPTMTIAEESRGAGKYTEQKSTVSERTVQSRPFEME